MRTHLMKSFIALMVFGALLAPASPSFAQSEKPDQFERAQADRLMRNAEHSSDQFVALFNQTADSQGTKDSAREGDLNGRARDLSGSLNHLRATFDQRGPAEEVRSELADAMRVGEEINNAMRNRRMSSQVQKQWSILRTDLNRLAAVFNVRQFS